MVIQEELFNESHSWFYIRICNLNGNKLRVEIRRNAYDDQSYCKISLWRDAWNFVTSIPFDSSQSQRVSYVDAHPNISLFKEDADKLEKLALEILS